MADTFPHALHDAAIFCLGMASAVQGFAHGEFIPLDGIKDLECVYWEHQNVPLSAVARQLNSLHNAPVQYGRFVRPNAHLICFDFAREVLDAVWAAADPEGYRQAESGGFDGSIRIDYTHFVGRWSAVAEALRSLELPDHRLVASAVQQEAARLEANNGTERSEGEPVNIRPDRLARIGNEPALPAGVCNWLIACYLSDPTPGQWRRTDDADPEPIVFVTYNAFAGYLLKAGVQLLPNLDIWRNAGWIEDVRVDLTPNADPNDSPPYCIARLKLPPGRHRLVGIHRAVLTAPTALPSAGAQESEGGTPANSILPVMLSASDIAKRISRNPKSVTSFLSRFAEKNPDCRIATESKRKNEPGYLYRTADVWPALEKWMKDNRKRPVWSWRSLKRTD